MMDKLILAAAAAAQWLRDNEALIGTISPALGNEANLIAAELEDAAKEVE